MLEAPGRSPFPVSELKPVERIANRAFAREHNALSLWIQEFNVPTRVVGSPRSLASHLRKQQSLVERL